METILVINGGSSSIKCVAFNAQTFEEIYRTSKSHTNNQSLGQCLKECFDDLTAASPDSEIAKIGIRVVHGGANLQSTTPLTPEVENTIAGLATLDPDHAPITLSIIRYIKELLPNTPLIASFDTTFFKDIPQMAQLTSLPKAYQSDGLRRYGFHGLSYTSITQKLAILDPELAKGKVIICHLGSGSSICSLRDSKPVDMTMGFSPASGLPMSTRSGDLDPGVVKFMAKQYNFSPEQMDEVFNKQSGLLGISGISADMKQLIELSPTTPSADEAVNFYCYQAAKSIAALTTTIEGLDGLVFTGGIGEASSVIRAKICGSLRHLGVQIDTDLNQQNTSMISVTDAPVKTYIIPTDEELVIARECQKINRQ